MELLESQDLNGVLLIRDKLDLSGAFLIPHLVQLALSADLRVAFEVVLCLDHLQTTAQPLWMQVVLLLVQESLAHYQQALRKLVSKHKLFRPVVSQVLAITREFMQGVNLAGCIASRQVILVSAANILPSAGASQIRAKYDEPMTTVWHCFIFGCS